MKKLNQKQIHILCMVLGGIFSLLLMMPYFILGKGSIITYHDQLDGELICYLLSAKYLFTGIKVYPELFNGLPSTGAVPPAWLFVCLYKILSPFAAFLMSQWIVYILGFLGMYLLIFAITESSFIAFLTGILFMLLPFYPVYGLCIPGQPLLIYSIMKFRKEDKLWRKLLFLGSVVLYSLCSSLVLVGFACLLALGIFAAVQTVYEMINRRKISFQLWIAEGCLLAGYLVTNLALIKQVLFPDEASLSHKAEIVHAPVPFLSAILSAVYPGINYAMSWPIMAFLLGISCLGFWIYFYRIKKKEKGKEISRLTKIALVVLVFLMLCALGNALFDCGFVVGIRNKMRGALGSFNLGRVAWMMPAAWMIFTACLMKIILIAGKEAGQEEGNKRFAFLCIGLNIMIAVIWAGMIFIHSPLKANVSKIIKGNDYYALDWQSFYAEDIYRQIDEAIGIPKENYRVVSIGIYPAAAAYNGFYCLDGYSNNYPLVYKHEFREVFAGELERSPFVRDYFDNWGNRCYITTAEYNNWYALERKWNGGFHELSINTEKLKTMGCKYVFAGTWILNAQELGLVPFREEPFVSDGSWYNIYVYEIP